MPSGIRPLALSCGCFIIVWQHPLTANGLKLLGFFADGLEKWLFLFFSISFQRMQFPSGSISWWEKQNCKFILLSKPRETATEVSERPNVSDSLFHEFYNVYKCIIERWRLYEWCGDEGKYSLQYGLNVMVIVGAVVIVDALSVN